VNDDRSVSLPSGTLWRVRMRKRRRSREIDGVAEASVMWLGWDGMMRGYSGAMSSTGMGVWYGVAGRWMFRSR